MANHYYKILIKKLIVKIFEFEGGIMGIVLDRNKTYCMRNAYATVDQRPT